MSLYNIKSLPLAGQFTITKFDDDLNVESSYEFHNTTNGYLCYCPAGQRPNCRHREMFPQLVQRKDSAWMLDFDTRQWVDPTGEASQPDRSYHPDECYCDGQGLRNQCDIDACCIMERDYERSQGSQGSPEFDHPRAKAQSLEGAFASGAVSLVEGTPEPTTVILPTDSHPFRRRM